MTKIHNAMMALMNDNLTADQKAKVARMMGYIDEEMMLQLTYPGQSLTPNDQ